ncbi:MAG TPA: glucoamylase family protein [Pyrinomonadaceae bacterium]|nr:glucoamylase family protein [Pyrinomonadaceae bacterium]
MATLFSGLIRRLKGAADAGADLPIREELYSIERLEQYAATLAAEHKIAEKPQRANLLLPRLEENGRKLIAAYKALADSIREEHVISPAAEWLVDNFHIVEEQVREIREDLPKGYYHELPKLAEGDFKEYPRIYALSVALIAHTDSHLDTETLRRFINAYQKVSPLSIGELWAVPISLRLALVENLRRLATRIVSSRTERDEADRLADKLLAQAQRQPTDLLPLLTSRVTRRRALGRPFVVQLTQRLREQDPAVMPVMEWLEKNLVKKGQSIEKIVQEEHQRQAAAQVTVGNIITSMRLLSTLDWKDFFETVSLIDPELAKDPAGVYSRMDFATRDRYRHVVERISKGAKKSEPEIARAALRMAEEARGAGADVAHTHVGYFLIAEGVSRLEAESSYRPRLGERARRVIERHATVAYLGTLTLLTALILGVTVIYTLRTQPSLLMFVIAALVSLIPASDLAVSVLNWDITHLFEPRLLPNIDLSKGVPAEARTMVVVPVIFNDLATVAALIDKLEIAWLANQDAHLHFALLSDFADGPTEEMAGDKEILDAARAGIEQLNQRYGKGEPIRFHLFHRSRQWCETEGKWIGWERKRGKLREFNQLLRGAVDTSFILATGSADLLGQIRYVISLDADTQLPRDAARRLIGTAIHPLNQPRFDPESERVVDGYGILQPRVSISLESASRSLFARIFSGNTGIDPYTTAASDVYQDLFREGSYTGKGLYDVDAFEKALADRVPDDILLSHDLFESIFARAALVSDIEFLDDYPAHYDTYAMRQHRWTRGDWQIAAWLRRTVRDAQGNKQPNRISAVSRWKILDNLRRSLLAPAIVLLLIAGWTILPGGPLWWTLFVLITLAFPVYAHVTTGLLIHPRGVPWTSHFWSVWGDMRTNTAQLALEVVFLAHQGWLMADAIGRTVYRKWISGRHLLEWQTAAHAEKSSTHDIPAFLKFMWPAEAITLVSAVLVILTRPRALPLAIPFLLSWALSPLIAFYVSRRRIENAREFATKDIRTARIVARRTWRFFETLVGDEDHWLPPDNLQEDPPVIAHRTSPTNIGLLQLSTLAAYDFGYLGLVELLERVEFTFASLEKLQKFRGHFFNWHDTRTLLPMWPQYVSVVDSGNLAGHLIALKQAALDLPDDKLFDRRVLNGLRDTVAAITQETSQLALARQRTDAITIKQLRSEIQSCASLLSMGTPVALDGWVTLFEAVNERATVIDDIVAALALEHRGDEFTELRWWTSSLLHEVHNYRRDLNLLAPWGMVRTWALDVIAAPAEVLRGHWELITNALRPVPSLAQISETCDSALVQLAALRAQIEASVTERLSDRDVALEELTSLTGAIEQAAEAARTITTRLAKIAQTCQRIVDDMDFKFLLDPERKVFTIGYNVAEGRHDNSFYDLLASEARLASFIAVAKGDVQQEHWFRMGRQLTAVDGGRALISWTGTMFEYLMPLLVMRNYRETLLGETYEAVISRQIEYGYERGVPWGISESAYSARDLQLNYQYGPFGVPGLGLKRGLIENLVVSPYSTILASNVFPAQAMENLRVLEREGALSRYGFYEALDYTPERVKKGERCTLVRAYMAHHQGMSLIALDNLINRNAMQNRFHSDPAVQATELLLQERIPRGVPAAHPRAEEVLTGRVVRTLTGLVTRAYDTADLPTPRTQLLSNGTYSVMITTAGAGYSMCGPLAVNRWREDSTRDNWGSFIYIRDVRSGAVWSAGHQPVGSEPQSYEVAFSEDKADFWRRDSGVVTHLEVIVSAEDNAEMRRVSVANYSTRPREIELTSYAEVVLASRADDLAHPAFSNLFIETEYHARHSALFARRRPRSSQDEAKWGVHVLSTSAETIAGIQYETDRSRFLGRGHTTAEPVAVMEDRPLSNTVGAVLDPIFSLRCRVRLAPNETAQVVFTTGVAQSRDHAIALAEKYRDANIFERESRMAWTRAQVEMSHLHIDPNEAHLFQRLAGRILYTDPSLRPRPHVLALNKLSQSGLWSEGISGDYPIVILRLDREEDIPMARQLMRGHQYLRSKGLQFDLVILNDHPTDYAQSLHDTLQLAVLTSGAQGLIDKPGGVFIRRSDIMPEEERILLHSVARVVIVSERGSLEDQLVRRPLEEDLPAPFQPRVPSQFYPETAPEPPKLSFFNGLGGFAHGGREYVVMLGEGQWAPAPWSNVIANNPDFGFMITETGAGFTWSLNSHENRITPWSNDAVSDPPSEVIYIRDEDSGATWTPTPLPIREAQGYLIRHGQGYSVFEHASHGISQELLLFSPLDAPVRISLLRLLNRSDRRRRLSVTSYQELVLGVTREASANHVVTDLEESERAIFARNSYNNEFSNRVAFVGTSEQRFTMTCDRKEFIGRNGTLARPAALRRTGLSGRDGAGLDPCAAIQTSIELAPGEAHQVIFLLGQAESIEEARAVNARWRSVHTVNEAFEKVLGFWDQVLGTVEIKTPDTSMDTLVNRWLLCQTLSCRVQGRSAFYQSSGAFGFRDQLQDVMALVYSSPDVARRQILRAAARQFKEGDVLHWWHEPTGRGVRTRFSDDLLWLPHVASFYVSVTGDYSVLEERVPFIDGPLLKPDQLEQYLQPAVSSESATVLEHCARAIDRSLRLGQHGLPLMGSGDWNDGMNRVGVDGKGESVWLGWFLCTVLSGFAPLCERYQMQTRSNRYGRHLEKLRKGLEQAWDGDWYRRAYFDDGTPLGSAMNDECRIDSIAQTWAVISRVAESYRAARAMAAVNEYLIRRGDGLIVLFTPPFDKSKLDPGYVKGYVPGVRENGGQYTHAALWTVIAFAMLGDGDLAGELFSLLNPINHSSTRAGLHKYKVEPYVAMGDVYAVPPHTGRGGWTWYTGSAGWMYRAALEYILGFKLEGDRLRIDPCIPRWWREFEINYRRGKSTYRIKVENPHGLCRGIAGISVDGREQSSDEVLLVDDGQTHEVWVVMGEKAVVEEPEPANSETAQPEEAR